MAHPIRVRKINDRLVNGFRGDIRRVVLKDVPELHVYCPVFGRIRRSDNDRRVEEYLISGPGL
jgi:hypothetical protein